MRKNNKGFTLIELLAIIVILAIIAVITVPIILNIIENSRKGAAIDSAYGYRDSIQQYYLSKSVNGEFDEVLSGEFTKNVSDLSDISVSGTKPTDGWVTIDKGQVVDYSLKFGDYVVNYDEATKGPVADKGGTVKDKPVPDPVSFEKDSWDTISISGNAAAKQIEVADNKCGVYNIGDKKTIKMDLDDDGEEEDYTVRIANCSTPTICSSEGFSQTACGFVIEFADIISNHVFNTSNTTKGGWPAEDTGDSIYTYINTTLYNKLPSDLKKLIIETKTISGHGSLDDDNFVSFDKLYLLDYIEVNGYMGPPTSMSSNETRKLDYYELATSNRIKKLNNIEQDWWLRGTTKFSSDCFFATNGTGTSANNNNIISNLGVAPAFRFVKSTTE